MAIEYPREIFLDRETEDRLIAYLDSVLMNHYAERAPHIDDLMQYQKDYWAKPNKEKATFPFSGAATIVIPLSAIAVEAIHARTMTTMFALPQFVTASAVSPDWGPAAAPMERFLDYELLHVNKFRRVLGDCFLEAEKFGTMIATSSYKKEVKTAVRMVGDVEQEFDVVTKQGACIEAVPDSRFLMPHVSRDPQTADWCGEEHTATPYQIQQLEYGGMFREGTFEKLKAFFSQSTTGTAGQETGRKFDDNQAKLEKTEPHWPNTIDYVKLWLAFDIDQSSRPKEIVVIYHRESKTFMSIRYNWHEDLRRPYRTGVFMPIEHRWRGLGICKQNEQFQREVTTQHRQRLDNATLANMKMIVISKLSNYGPKEPVFPGKMWFLDDVDQINSFSLGEIYPSSYSNEQATLIYSQQRLGIGELQLGMPQVGTPGTATSDLARIQEGNKKFDFIYANFKEFTNELIMDFASNVQQFGPRRVSYYETSENGQLVKAFFDMPNELVREGLLLNVKASGQQGNDVLDRQNWTQIAQTLNMYYQGIMQLAMPLGDQQILQLILTRGLAAATEAMRQILESYPNVRNIDKLVVKELDVFGTQKSEPVSGGTQQPPSLGQNPGMDVFSQIIGALGAGSDAGINQLSGLQ